MHFVKAGVLQLVHPCADRIACVTVTNLDIVCPSRMRHADQCYGNGERLRAFPCTIRVKVSSGPDPGTCAAKSVVTVKTLLSFSSTVLTKVVFSVARFGICM